MKNRKLENYSMINETDLFNPKSKTNEFNIKDAEKRFAFAIKNNFDRFIIKWIKNNVYNRSMDGFRYFDNSHKSSAYIEFITAYTIEVETEDFIEYTYLKFMDKVDNFFTNDCYLLTDQPHRFYKFKH